MIKILDNSKSLDLLVNDNTNGLGQFEANSCFITEELNGIYECDITMLATDKHFEDLSVGGLLKVPVNDTGNEQIFRIYYIGKPINQVVEIKTQHITYDLNKVAVKPFNATGAVNAKNGMLNNVLGTYPFTMTTNISNTTSKFTLDIPRSFRECLGGYEGSLLDVFRGEYEWDNLTVKMLAKRGSDNGVRIAYGKNLTDFKQEENIENVYTSVLGYAVVNDTTYTGNIYHKVSATYPKVKIVDFSSDYEGENVPTTAQLTQKAKTYAENNDIEVPNINLTISFVPLYQTEEYKDIAPLERVSLGDTVHIFFDKLNVEASARVIKTVWNVNLGRYDEIELGNAKTTLNSVINEATNDIKNEIINSIDTDTGFLESQLNQMASVIINGLGLHWTLVDTGDGAYRIYLHNKKTLAESDTQYIFTSEGFLISTDYGKTWNAGFDSSGNAILNSLATITLKALEINGSTINGSIINGGTINFGTDTSKIISMSSNDTGALVSGKGRFEINIEDDDNTKAKLLLTKDSSNNGIGTIQIFDNNSETLGALGISNLDVELGYYDSKGDIGTGIQLQQTGKADIKSSGNMNIASSGALSIEGEQNAMIRIAGKGYISIDANGDLTIYGFRNLRLGSGSNLLINDSTITLGSDGNVKWSNKQEVL